MNESFEMRRVDGPGDLGEIILVIIDRYTAVQRMLPRISDLTINYKDFLVNL